MPVNAALSLGVSTDYLKPPVWFNHELAEHLDSGADSDAVEAPRVWSVTTRNRTDWPGFILKSVVASSISSRRICIWKTVSKTSFANRIVRSITTTGWQRCTVWLRNAFPQPIRQTRMWVVGMSCEFGAAVSGFVFDILIPGRWSVSNTFRPAVRRVITSRYVESKAAFCETIAKR